MRITGKSHTPDDEHEPYVYFRRHTRRRVRFWSIVVLLSLLFGGLALLIKSLHDTVTDRLPFNYEPYRELTPRSIDEKQRQFKEWEARERERRAKERDLVRRGQLGETTDSEYGREQRSR